MIQGSGEKVSVPSRLRKVWEPFLNHGQDRGFGVIHDAVEAHAGGPMSLVASGAMFLGLL